MEKRKVIIVGSGPAALALAAFLNENRFDIHIYEKNSAAGRKFLVAGDGGFNLTHSEDIETFITRYAPADFLKDALTAFDNIELVRWLYSIGIPTYVGSSKRVFPEKGIKPIDVLDAILNILKKKNVQFHFEHEWLGWKNSNLLFANENEVEADIVVFALGGSSWKVTGSDGAWTKYFAEKNISIVPFQPSNCAMQLNWPETFREKYAGQALKNISVKCGSKERKGELVVTAFGLEGGAIYYHSPEIRRQLSENSFAEIFIDLRPDKHFGQLKQKLAASKSDTNRTKQLKAAFNLSDVQLALLKERCSKEDFLSYDKVCTTMKHLKLKVVGMAPIDEAISNVGGISLDEVNENFELKKLPEHYVIGEMLDWDAPTGGYLLQACFSMGRWLADELNASVPG
jgi:uncharacterized flavoprotein (TIGR03862 family)